MENTLPTDSRASAELEIISVRKVVPVPKGPILRKL